MYMYLSNAKRYYALNDRTINWLMEGNVDMGATTGGYGTGDGEGGLGDWRGKTSDAEAAETVKKEKQVETFIVDKHKSRWIILSIS